MSEMHVKQPKGVKLDHISKIYQDPKTKKDFYAVHDVELDIAPGSFVTLLGPSGCGKTTTLRMIAGFESPDEGEIYLGGEPINELTPNKRDTAMVFQSYALFPHYNVFDNVAYGLKLRKVPRDEIRTRVERILKLVELSGMEQRMTNQLSGGQQQRVWTRSCGCRCGRKSAVSSRRWESPRFMSPMTRARPWPSRIRSS